MCTCMDFRANNFDCYTEGFRGKVLGVYAADSLKLRNGTNSTKYEGAEVVGKS